MKKIIFTYFVFILFTTSIFAQARKFNEFSEINSESLTATLEQVRNEIAETPNSFAQIMIFRGEKNLPSFPLRLGTKISSFLVMYGIKEDRIIVTPCNYETIQKTEIWILENKESLKSCEPNSTDFSKTILFDLAYYGTDGGDTCCLIDSFGYAENESAINAFAKLLKDNPDSKAYLYIYLGSGPYGLKNGRTIQKYDSPRFYAKMSKNIKRGLKQNGVNLKRVVFKNSGYKGWTRNIEFWFVPKDGKTPKPKPSYISKTNKQKVKK
jgi:hypothetical protein